MLYMTLIVAMFVLIYKQMNNISHSKSLSRENFEKLKDLKISEKYSSHIFTKDLFLFAYYRE